MSKHTKEPWKLDNYSGEYIWGPNDEMIVDLDPLGEPIIRMRGLGANLPMTENLERIVACVNAMAGIKDPAKFIECVDAMSQRVMQTHSDYKTVQIHRALIKERGKL